MLLALLAVADEPPPLLHPSMADLYRSKVEALASALQRDDTLNPAMLWGAIIQVLTGIGLGGAMPNIIALTNEYAPARSKATLVTVMFCGFPLGAAFGGFLAAWMIPIWGWRSVLVLGGVAPTVGDDAAPGGLVRMALPLAPLLAATAATIDLRQQDAA